MDVVKHRPLGILGPVMYDFALLHGLDPGTFASDHAFVWASAHKRAESSPTYAPRFVAAVNMTLLFYWNAPDSTSAPKGVFSLNRESTVEYMPRYEGKEHVVIIRPLPSHPTHRVVYLSLPSEAQARQLAQKLVECRPEVLALSAEMAKANEHDARHELETANLVRTDRNKLLNNFRATIERAWSASALLKEVEMRLAAAWRAHGLFHLDGPVPPSEASRGGRRWTAGGASPAGQRTPSRAGASSPVHTPRLAGSPASTPGFGQAGAGLHSAASGAIAASRSVGWSADGSRSSGGAGAASRRLGSAARSSAALNADEAAAESLRILAEMESGLRAAAADAARLEAVAARAEDRFKRLAQVNGVLVRQFRHFVRDWGPAGAARQFGRASALSKEQRQRVQSQRRAVRSRAASDLPPRPRGRSDSSLTRAGASLTEADATAFGLLEEDERGTESGALESGPAGARAADPHAPTRLRRGLAPTRSGSAGRAASGSSPRLPALRAAVGLAAGEGAAASPLGRARSSSVGAAPESAGPAAPGAADAAARASAAGSSAGQDGGGSSKAFSRLMVTADGELAPGVAPPPVRHASAASSSQLSEDEVQDMLKHLPPPPSATDDPFIRSPRPDAAAFTPARRASTQSEPRRSIFGGLFARKGAAPEHAKPAAAPSKPPGTNAAGASTGPVSAAAAAAASSTAAAAATESASAEASDDDITTDASHRYPGRVIALVMQVQNLHPSAIAPSNWAFVAVDAYGVSLRSPPIQAFLDPETKRTCALSVRGAKGGFVALSFNVNRPMTDASANLQLRVVGQKTFRADLTLGECAIATWQLQQWPGKAHAVWAELEPAGKGPASPKPYEIPVPVGQDLRRPDRAALAELPPPPISGKPCVLLQLVYAVMRPGDTGRLPRVRFFDSARARREMDAARAQVERMRVEAGNRGFGAGEVVFGDKDEDAAGRATAKDSQISKSGAAGAAVAGKPAGGAIAAGADGGDGTDAAQAGTADLQARLDAALAASATHEADKAALSAQCADLRRRADEAEAHAAAAEASADHSRRQLQALARAYKRLQAKFDASTAKPGATE